MRKLILASVSLLALAGVAQADPFHNQPLTGTLSAQIDITKTTSVNFTKTQSHAWDNYRGFSGFTHAEHGGLVKTQTNGNALGVGASLNYSNANFSGSQGGCGCEGFAPGLNANSESVSGSLALGGSIGAGSSKVETAGYASGGAGARQEWGTSYTNTTKYDTTVSTNWKGSGSLTSAR
jgi:hypothetical protein